MLESLWQSHDLILTDNLFYLLKVKSPQNPKVSAGIYGQRLQTVIDGKIDILLLKRISLLKFLLTCLTALHMCK